MKETFQHTEFREASLRMIAAANAIIQDIVFEQGYTLTLRQLYYQLVSAGTIPNRQNEYDKLGVLIVNARLAGLIDWAAIEDRTRNVQSVAHWQSPAQIVDIAAKQYRIDKWSATHGQTHRPEVWVEKDALIGVLERVCTELDVPYFSCRGFTSHSELYSAAKRLGAWRRAGQTPIIIHLGDHDPSGIDMTRDIEARVSMFMRFPIEVKRIALNWNQIEEYNSPPNPAKQTDSRFKAYAEEYGEESWELDALSPQVISDLITEAVTELRDDDAWEEATAEEERERLALTATSAHWPIISEQALKMARASGAARSDDISAEPEESFEDGEEWDITDEEIEEQIIKGVRGGARDAADLISEVQDEIGLNDRERVLDALVRLVTAGKVNQSATSKISGRTSSAAPAKAKKSAAKKKATAKKGGNKK